MKFILKILLAPVMIILAFLIWLHKSLRKPHVHGVLAPPCRESSPTFTH